QVEVRVARSGRTARLSVRDVGPGIPVDRREEIFEPFVRLRRRRTEAATPAGSAGAGSAGPGAFAAGPRPTVAGATGDPISTDGHRGPVPTADGVASIDRLPDGSGLGLAIARAIVTRMQGDIRVDDNAGRGAVFTISLPSA